MKKVLITLKDHLLYGVRKNILNFDFTKQYFQFFKRIQHFFSYFMYCMAKNKFMLIGTHLKPFLIKKYTILRINVLFFIKYAS